MQATPATIDSTVAEPLAHPEPLAMLRANPERPSKEELQLLILKLAIPAAAVVLLLVHLLVPNNRIDAITFGLVVMAFLPWLSVFFINLEFPGGWKLQFRELKHEQDKQRDDIERINIFLIANFLTQWEYNHLIEIAQGIRVDIDKHSVGFETFKGELIHLRQLGLIDNFPGRGIRAMDRLGGVLTDYFYITERGREYLKLRDRASLIGPTE